MDSEDLQAYSIPELEQICREQKALYTPEELEQSHFSKYCFSAVICSLMLGMLLLTGGFQF
ncbi:MAG: hypothetical protein K2H29_05795 [Oscillospiraceae bacterium]|nr:hypothetical protein [Oscillospiraceae bacterium]